MEGLPAQQEGEDRVATDWEWRVYNTYMYSASLICLGLCVFDAVAYLREKDWADLVAAILMGLAALLGLGLLWDYVPSYVYLFPCLEENLPEENSPGRRRDATRPVV